MAEEEAEMESRLDAVEMILRDSRVMPVMTVRDAGEAVDIARSLVAGGVRTLEVTLRTECALDAVARMCAEVKDVRVGVGTVVSTEQLYAARDAGACFAVSPGIREDLIETALDLSLPYLPGVSTGSEIMAGMRHGLRCFKFSPAELCGGTAMLKALAGPFPNIRFCATGGVGESQIREYLQLPNVLCVAGSWLAPGDLVRTARWEAIGKLARRAVALAA